MKLIALGTMDKIPFVAQIISSFLDPQIDDSQIVNLLLEYKVIK
jgi:hypothetical protein